MERPQGVALLDRWRRRDFGWAPWDGLGRAIRHDDPDSGHLASLLEIVDREAIRRCRFKVVLDACHGAGGRLASRLLEALGAESLVLGAQPDGRYDHPPEPTEKNLRTFSAIVPAVGAAVGFAQDPDADRLAIVDETGRYIGEELTLALAARRRLEQARGPVVINLSTSLTDRGLARERGCPVFRTPVGEINVVERMIAEKAILGGEGNGGVIDPRVGFVRDSFAAMAMILDLMAESGMPLSRLVAELPRFTMVKDHIPVPDIGTADASDVRACGVVSPRHSRTLVPIVATACASNGTTAGCTSAPAIPSRSSVSSPRRSRRPRRGELSRQVGRWVAKTQE